MGMEAMGLLVWGLIFLVPPVLGFMLGRTKPSLSWERVGSIGGTPGSLPPLAFAIFLHITAGVSQPENCNPPDCNGAALWIYALYAVALFAFVVGFVFACGGRALGRRSQK